MSVVIRQNVEGVLSVHPNNFQLCVSTAHQIVPYQHCGPCVFVHSNCSIHHHVFRQLERCIVQHTRILHHALTNTKETKIRWRNSSLHIRHQIDQARRNHRCRASTINYSTTLIPIHQYVHNWNVTLHRLRQAYILVSVSYLLYKLLLFTVTEELSTLQQLWVSPEVILERLYLTLCHCPCTRLQSEALVIRRNRSVSSVHHFHRHCFKFLPASELCTSATLTRTGFSAVPAVCELLCLSVVEVPK